MASRSRNRIPVTVAGNRLVGLALSVWICLAPALHARDVAPSSSPPPRGTEIGLRAPNLPLKGLNGKTYDPGAPEEERAVLLVFWATWCAPCLEEIPRLQEAYRKYREQGLEILAIGVDINQREEELRSFARARRLEYPVVFDRDGKALEAYQVIAIPQTYLLDAEGVIRFAGYALPVDLEARIERLLERTAG